MASDNTNKTMKTTKMIQAMLLEIPARPVKPNTPAMSAKTRKTNAQLNMTGSLLLKCMMGSGDQGVGITHDYVGRFVTRFNDLVSGNDGSHISECLLWLARQSSAP